MEVHTAAALPPDKEIPRPIKRRLGSLTVGLDVWRRINSSLTCRESIPDPSSPLKMHWSSVIRVKEVLIHINYKSKQARHSNSCHHAVRTTTGSQPLPKRVLQTARSSASSFNFQYLLVSLRSYSSCLRLLPGLPVPSTFLSITCFIRQFLRNMWPIQSPFLRLNV